MDPKRTIQGRSVGAEEIAAVRDLIAHNPGSSRYKLSRALAVLWDWRDPSGRIKDMAARALLGKLEARGWIRLPAKRRESPNRMRHKRVVAVAHATEPIVASLEEVCPLEIRELSQSPEYLPLYDCLLRQYHYLSYTSPVGLNLKYLVLDRHGRPLSCLLFGSAAWKCASRDHWIGWSLRERETHLQKITNNSRFLILPWVQVSSLATHILSGVTQRIAQDWRRKYARPLCLLETFVDASRFDGRCYQAANWIGLGQTTGRTRQDRWNRISVPPKLIFVHPLLQSFCQELRS